MALITIFLRGGADGLALVPPVGDDAYAGLRPTTRLAAGQGHRLDGRHVLHPDLAPLIPLWESGGLRIEPAAGTPEDSRSHFVAQDWLEHGGGDVAGGWLGRWLRGSNEALAAVAFGDGLPESLRGAPAAVALQELAELARPGGEALAERLCALAEGDPLLAAPSVQALAVHRRLAELSQRPVPAGYPDSGFGRGLASIAGLLHADVGVRTACLDLAGWDSHIAMEAMLTPMRRELAAGIAALLADLGPRLATTRVVVMTEFGRRCAENASLGTDHGRAGCAFAFGGGVHGGLGPWPGLAQLEGPGDLPVATDLRSLLLDLLALEGPVQPGVVFPGFSLETQS